MEDKGQVGMSKEEQEILPAGATYSTNLMKTVEKTSNNAGTAIQG